MQPHILPRPGHFLRLHAELNASDFIAPSIKSGVPSHEPNLQNSHWVNCASSSVIKSSFFKNDRAVVSNEKIHLNSCLTTSGKPLNGFTVPFSNANISPLWANSSIPSNIPAGMFEDV